MLSHGAPRGRGKPLNDRGLALLRIILRCIPSKDPLLSTPRVWPLIWIAIQET